MYDPRYTVPDTEGKEDFIIDWIKRFYSLSSKLHLISIKFIELL